MQTSTRRDTLTTSLDPSKPLPLQRRHKALKLRLPKVLKEHLIPNLTRRRHAKALAVGQPPNKARKFIIRKQYPELLHHIKVIPIRIPLELFGRLRDSAEGVMGEDEDLGGGVDFGEAPCFETTFEGVEVGAGFEELG